jgi:hypothetical protein
VELFAARGGADMFAQDFEGRTPAERAAARAKELRAETVEWLTTGQRGRPGTPPDSAGAPIAGG